MSPSHVYNVLRPPWQSLFIDIDHLSPNYLFDRRPTAALIDDWPIRTYLHIESILPKPKNGTLGCRFSTTERTAHYPGRACLLHLVTKL